MLCSAVAVARISNAVAALTTPLRTGSPTARSTCSGSPVRTDSSSTATAPSIRPSTGTTSPGPTTSRSPTTTSPNGITLTWSPTRRRAKRGARSSSARKSCEARRCAAASNARPVDSITAINAPATYSPTNSVPTNDNTASRSTPARPWRNDTTTHTSAGTTAISVPATQHPSATARHPMSHAIPPSTSAATVTTSKVGSTSDRSRSHHGRVVDSGSVTAHSFVDATPTVAYHDVSMVAQFSCHGSRVALTPGVLAGDDHGHLGGLWTTAVLTEPSSIPGEPAAAVAADDDQLGGLGLLDQLAAGRSSTTTRRTVTSG